MIQLQTTALHHRQLWLVLWLNSNTYNRWLMINHRLIIIRRSHIDMPLHGLSVYGIYCCGLVVNMYGCSYLYICI